MMDTGQLVGFIAAGLSCVAALPHLMKSWKHGTQGVSSTAWVLAAINSTLWVTFAVMTHTYATLISSVVNGFIALAILFLVIKEKHAREELVAEQQPVTNLAPMRIPPRVSVATRIQRLQEREASLNETFEELTRTLEFELTRSRETEQFEPAR